MLFRLAFTIFWVIAAVEFTGCASILNTLPDSQMLDKHLNLDTSRAKTIDDQWYTIYHTDKKIGWWHFRSAILSQKDKQLQIHTQTIYKKYYRYGQKVEQWEVTRTVHDQDDGLVSQASINTGGNQKPTVQIVTYKQGDLYVTTRRNQTEVCRKIDTKAREFLPMLHKIRSLSLKTNKAELIHILDLKSHCVRFGFFQVLEKTKIRIENQEIDVWHATLNSLLGDPALDVYIRNGDKPTVVKIVKHNEPISFLLASKTTANSGLDKYDFNEMYDVKDTKSISAPWTAAKITISFSNPQLDQILIEEPWQIKHTKSSDEKSKWTILARAVNDNEADELPLSLESEDENIKSTFYIQCDDARIKQKALEIKTDETNALRLLRRIAMWVHYNLEKKNYRTTFASALEILERMEGDCTEHTLLTVALARAVGIPARIAVGLVYVDERWTYHMWAEGLVAKDTWAAVDPSLGQIIPDAFHLKFFHGNFDLETNTRLTWSLIQSVREKGLQILEIQKDGEEKN